MPQDTVEQVADYIRALLEERRGVAQRLDRAPEDDKERIAARLASIDAELTRSGHKGTPPARRAERRPAPQAEVRD